MKKFTIWLDGDACPRSIKEIVFKASKRTSVPTVVVANSLPRVEKSPFISCVVVSSAFDAADNYIVTHCQEKDLVITADLPLADLVVAKGARALNPRGKVYTASNIKDQLSMRNLLTEFRGGLMSTGGGPKEFGAADIKTFAAAFDRLLQQGLKGI
jgi:uncharacterized protein YaiI (UPF0178 family)